MQLLAFYASLQKSHFIDHLRLFIKGGAGGQGFPKYGGRGGRGGNVYLVAAERASLKEILQKYPKKRIAAGTGANSKYVYHFRVDLIMLLKKTVHEFHANL